VPEGGKKYCLACICDNCHSPLLGNFTVKNGKKYCDGCNCFDCGVPLTNGFYEEGNLRFCDGCNDKHNKEKTPTLPEKGHGHGHGHGPHDHTHDHGHDKDHKHGAGPTHVHGPNCAHDTQDLKMKTCKACDKPVAPPSKGKPPAGDRVQFCPPHGDEYCCAHCDLEMSGAVVEAQGKRYHPACHDELKKQKNPKCGGCAKPIEGKPLDALNQKWHQQCFNCTSCHAPFPDGNFIEGDNGKPYCNNCDAGGETTDLSWGPNDKCGGCPKPLAGKVTNVMNKFWHEGCFKCTKCSAKFTSGYYPFNEMPYCEPCHAEVSGADKCAKCKGVLDGESVQSHEKMWHKRCFTCTTCNKGPLTKDFALIKFGKPYCKVCHAQASAVCPKCRNAITGPYTESGGKVYCEKCAPVTSKNVWGSDKTQGFVIDPRSGKRTFVLSPK